MQRMCYSIADRVLRGRQRLPQNLATKYLGAANIATVAAENIVLDSLELKQMNQVLKNRIQTQSLRRPPSTAIPVPLTNTESSLAKNSATFATSTGSPMRPAAEFFRQ